MNRAEQVTRLQSLLERVQTRAKERRPKSRAAAALSLDPAGGKLEFDIAPVAMPTAEPFDMDETRPFAKIPSLAKAQEQVAPVQLTPSVQDVEVSIEASEMEIDDVGEGGLEIVGAEDQEPFASSERDAAARELEIELGHTPAAKPTDLEVDETLGDRGTPQQPSIEMLGQTVDLPEGKKDETLLELDREPLRPPQRERPTGEMEAVIPGSVAPGVYPPTRPEPKREAFPSEPLTTDWELPGDVESPPAGKAQTEPQQASAATKQPAELKLDEAFELEPPAVEDKKPAPAQPLQVEIAGQVITAPAMAQADVAVFVGSLKVPESMTLFDALDASLALGKESP